MAIQKSPDEYKRAYEYHKAQGNAAKAKRVANLYREQLRRDQQQDSPFSGFGNTFLRGIDQPLENFGTTAEVLGNPELAEKLRGAMDTRPGLSATSQFFNADQDGSFAYRYLPKAAVEQAGQFAGSILSRAGGAAAGGAVAGPKGAVVGALAGPALFEAIQQLGPIALERAKNNGREKPNASDFKYAMATSAGVGALNTIAPGQAGKLRRAVVEAVTEGTQSVGEQVGSTIDTKKGLEVDPRQALGEGIIGGSSAGLVDSTISTAQSAANLVSRKDKKPVSDRESQAQADFASRLTNIVEDSKRGTGPNYNLRDVDPDSRSGAKQVIDSAHSDMAQQLKTLVATLKERIKPKKTDLLDQILEKSDAALAAVKAKNKVKNVVEPRDFDAFEKLTGDLQEGQMAINLMHEMNELTRVYSDGLTGGVSRYTDALAPIGALDNYSNTGGVMQQFARPIATGALMMSNPGLAAAQIGTFAAGRGIDAVTGRRSRVNSYVAANQGNPGQPTPTGRSLTDEKAQEELNLISQQNEADAQAQQVAEQTRQREDEKTQANLKRVQEGAPPKFESPEAIIRDGTGLTRSQIAQVLRILKANPNTLPDTLRAIEAYETSIATGGRVDYDLIRDVNQFVDNNGPALGISPTTRNSSALSQGKARQNLTQKEQNYERGIRANQDFAESLKVAVAQDNSVSPIDKALITSALSFVQSSPITKDPVARMQAEFRRLEERGVNPQALNNYFLPYVSRVQDQQVNSSQVQQAADEVSDIDESRTVNPVSANSPNVIALMEGSEKPPVMKGKKQVAKYLEQRALDRMGGKPRDIQNKQDQKAIAEDMAREAVYEMESSDNPNFEWYDTVIDKTIEMMSVKHPELLSDPQAKTALLVSIAITSQNLAVPENLKYGEEVYSHYAKTGKFLEKKYGSKGGAVLKNLEKANTLLNKLGSMEKMREFLETKFTVRELNPILQEVLGVSKVSGELIDTEVYGSQLFGPKIGNGFYTNLRGDFSPVTIDMWFMRTVGRLSGKLMEFDPAKFAEHSERLKTAIGRKRISKEALIAEARKIKSQHEKDYKKYRDDYDDGTRKKSEAVLAAETMIKGLDGTIDTPGAGKDKKALRDITRMAVARFNELTGLDIPPASFQALIWYPEQDLYSKLGVQLKSLRADYASSTKKILMEEGFNEKDLDTAANRVRQRTQLGTGQVRPSSTENVQEENRASNLPVSRTIREENQEIDFSLQPALTQPEQISFAFNTPTPTEVKSALPEAKTVSAMVIGKQGTKYADGLTTVGISELADKLNVSIGIFDTLSSVFDVPEQTVGLYQDDGGTSGFIGVLRDQSKSETFKTLVHEISHPLEGRSIPSEFEGSYIASPVHMAANLNNKKKIYKNSLREKIRKETQKRTEVYNEIEALQASGLVRGTGRGLPFAARVNFEQYAKSDGEFAVDPVMFYLSDPKAMKKQMPATFKLMQGHFNRASSPINIYTNPLATILAIVLAGSGAALRGLDEEEEGALSMQRGALSA